MEYAAFLFTLGIVLVFAKMFDTLFEKGKLPGVLGEIVLGIILGNLVLYGFYFGPDIHAWLQNWIQLRGAHAFQGEEPVHYIANLGIVMLLFIAGLDTNIDQLKSTGKVATFSTVMGVFVPLVIGWLSGLALGYNMRESLVMGVLLTATSIGVTVRTLLDINMLRTDVGAASLSASVMDDFLGIFLIIFVVGSGSLVVFGVQLAIFFIVTLIAAWYYMPYITKFTRKYIKTERGMVGVLLGVMLLFSTLAEYSFGAAIEGAYFAGIVLSALPAKKIVIEDIRAIGYGFLIPLFFVYTGAQMDIGVFTNINALILAAVILAVAIFGKILGRGIGARIGGFNWHKAWQMGVGSVPRMEVALVSLTVAINAPSHPIQPQHVELFIAATMVFVTVTTLITPPLLKLSFRKEIKEMQG
ncbi:MAG: cation:proton antiporter [Euryarchaeota archaeon]|nr:cation:proton antiporter [Euryarchaeota archaeon]